ncbi:MAG: Response regulator UvrY [bacterium]|nr:Response regulator UvrY [bacterium]
MNQSLLRPIKILIADDHAVVRAGLRQILSDYPEIIIGGEACNAAEVLEKVSSERWDVILLDLSMPGRSGLEILRELRSHANRSTILVLSIHPEDQYAIQALKLGAAGYLTKESTPDELIDAIRKVVTGGKYVTQGLAEKLAFNLEEDSDTPPHARLSGREYEVFRMIAAGKGVSAIAVELSLSVKTVSTYRARILAKMRMRTNAELTFYAVKNGLVDGPLLN